MSNSTIDKGRNATLPMVPAPQTATISQNHGRIQQTPPPVIQPPRPGTASGALGSNRAPSAAYKGSAQLRRKEKRRLERENEKAQQRKYRGTQNTLSPSQRQGENSDTAIQGETWAEWAANNAYGAMATIMDKVSSALTFPGAEGAIAQDTEGVVAQSSVQEGQCPLNLKSFEDLALKAGFTLHSNLAPGEFPDLIAIGDPHHHDAETQATLAQLASLAYSKATKAKLLIEHDNVSPPKEMCYGIEPAAVRKRPERMTGCIGIDSKEEIELTMVEARKVTRTAIAATKALYDMMPANIRTSRSVKHDMNMINTKKDELHYVSAVETVQRNYNAVADHLTPEQLTEADKLFDSAQNAVSAFDAYVATRHPFREAHFKKEIEKYVVPNVQGGFENLGLLIYGNTHLANMKAWLMATHKCITVAPRGG